MTLPEAGWLPDPATPGLERYWDGGRWTDAVRVAGATPVRVSTPPPPAGLDVTAAQWERAYEQAHRRLMPVRIAFAAVGALVVGALLYSILPDLGFGWVGGSNASLAAAEQAVDATTVQPAGSGYEYPLTGSTEFSRYLEAALIEHEGVIAVPPWVAGSSDLDAIHDAMYEVDQQSPYVFIDTWTVRTVGGEPRTLTPTYSYDEAETERRQIAVLTAAQTAVVELGVPALAPAQQVDVIHDYVAYVATYDDEAAARNDEDPELYRESQEAYGILVTGTAVCGGYAKAFQALALEAGLETVIVTGDSWVNGEPNRHAWNRVLIDGEWLTVDVTFDDSGDYAPIPDTYLLLAGTDRLLDTRAADDYWISDANLGAYGS